MNDFFANLVGRHLGRCETIQPRTLGPFEAERDGMAATPSTEEVNRPVAEHNQVPQPPADRPHVQSKERALDINSFDLSVARGNHQPHPADPSPPSSADRPGVAISEPASVEGKKNDQSPSFLVQSDASVQPDANGDQPGSSASISSLLDVDKHPHRNLFQEEPAGRLAFAASELPTFSETAASRDHRQTPEASHHIPSTLRVGENHLENESDLNHRVRTMLQYLTEDLKRLAVADDQRRENSDSPVSTLPEKEAPPSAVVVAPQLQQETLKWPADQENSGSVGERENTPHHERLEPPSWLSGIEAQFQQHLQAQEVKAEPVINVTIGRIEVRAVQAEKPKSAQAPKKPTGVMTLDEYLQRREGGRR
ncbi:MAG: hypothetical protein L3J94_04750 [Gammaproteobacteria bacterium]|nr:hypothetical protein [Gammaproteobacteria bacterium]